MMLHDKLIPGHFLLDYKRDCTNSILNSPQPVNKLDIYNGFTFHNQDEQQPTYSPSPTEGEVLDLSRRCDSVETRKTPSPYNSTYSYGTNSPSTYCSSPSNSINTTQTHSTSAPSVPSQLSDKSPAAPPTPQDTSSLYPLYYPNVKPEVLSPPPAPIRSMISSRLPVPIFPNTSSLILQQALINSPKSDNETRNSLPSIPSDTTSLLYPNILNAATTGSIHSGKATRPFNAYPRDPALVAAHFTASDVLFDKTSMERYSNFRKRALDDLRDTNGGHRIVTNPKMRRTNTRRSQNSESEERAVESSDYESSTGNATGEHPNNDTNNNNNSSTSKNNDSESNETNSQCGSGNIKDEAYYERRRKNNAAAKKSRDRRRIKEDEIAIRAAYLERQNIELLCQIEALKKQLEIYTKV